MEWGGAITIKNWGRVIIVGDMWKAAQLAQLPTVCRNTSAQEGECDERFVSRWVESLIG